MHNFSLLIAVFTVALSSITHAAVQTEEIEYQDGDVKLKGILAWDDAIDGKRPGVLVVHEWWGLNDYARKRTEMLAESGYVAFAADMYGDGKVTEHGDQAKEWMTQITSNMDAWLQRANLGLEILKQHELVDSANTAAIGYCFGGGTVMQMAYGGSDVKGVASFHGPLAPATEDQYENINASIFVAHGNDDAFVPADRIVQFREALTAAGADWQMTYYANARHGFTNPDAGKFGMDNLKYDENADQRSWQAMHNFFAEIFVE